DGDQPDGHAGPLHADDTGRHGARRGAARHRQARHPEEARMTAASNRRLEGRTALVVGAARGIGEGIAARFLREGARVVIADTEAAAGEATARKLGGPARVRFIATDIARKDQAERAVAEAVDRFGALDILVQNAGI